MRTLIVVLLLAFACGMPASQQEPTREELKQTLESIVRLNRENIISLTHTEQELAAAQAERDAKQVEIDQQAGQLRDCAISSAHKSVTIMKLYMTLGGLALAIAAYAVAKFYFRLPI